MDLNRVATFVEVIERGSFTAAARALGLPVSSVSRGVARLEQEVGTRLLQRTTRRLAPTAAGQAFFDRARDSLQGLHEARDAATEAGSVVRGTIRITAPAGDNGSRIAPALATFLRAYPEVKLELILTSRTVDLVEEGIDLALRAAPRLKDSALVARKVASTPLQLFAAPAYLEARGVPRKLADLAGHDMVLLRASRHRTRLVLAGPRGPEAVEVGGRISVDELSFGVHAAIAGLGIVAAPRLLADEAIRAGKLRRVLPRHGLPGAALWLVHASGRQLPVRVALLRDHLAEELGRVWAVS